MTIPARYRDSVEVAAAHGHHRAARLLEEDRKAKGRKRVKAAPRLVRQRSTKERRQENWGLTRQIVGNRAAGRCECCTYVSLSLDVHHLVGGPLRRKYEAANACVALCRECHNATHRSELLVLERLQNVAELIGAPPIVLATLNRRVQKATP